MDTTLSGLLPWGVGLSLSGMTISLVKLTFRLATALFFQTVKYHGWWYTIAMK
jgi:hypothetical protein